MGTSQAPGQEFVRLNLRIMSILGPFMLAVLLPLHFVASRESHNTLDFLSRLDIGNLPRRAETPPVRL